MKHPFRFGVLIIALVAVMGVITGAIASAAAHASTESGRDAVSEFATSVTGTVLDWNAIDALPNNQLNIAQMAQLPSTSTVVEAEESADEFIKFMGTSAYTGTLEVVSPDRGACLVGVIVQGYAARNGISLNEQAVRNTLQALVFTQFDIHEPIVTVPQAWEALKTATATSGGDWPKGVAGFEQGLTVDLTKGLPCGLQMTTAA